jgi:L-lactate dehydrogenase
MNKIGIVGVGHVGAHCAYTLALQGIAGELILADIDEKKQTAEVQDLRDSCLYFPHPVRVMPGTFRDMKDCDLIVISAGGMTEEEDRLSELRQSNGIVEACVPEIVQSGFQGIFLVITNPCDIITARVKELSGFPASRVIGTGTGLDSARLASVLARETGLNPGSLTCFTLGEHGDSQIAPWSCFRIGGLSFSEWEETYLGPGKINREAVLQEVKRAAWVIFAGKHATEYGIAGTLAVLARSILWDEKRILPVSVDLNGAYGETGICASTLCRIGRGGAEEVFELKLTEEERKGFRASCRIIREHLESLR